MQKQCRLFNIHITDQSVVSRVTLKMNLEVSDVVPSHIVVYHERGW